MSEEYPYEKIIEECPLLYAHCKFIDCGPGWYHIISELSKDLEVLIKSGTDRLLWSEEDIPCASQVKEKYGTLRFYMGTMTDSMDLLIQAAERASTITCEICGNPGKTKNHHSWYLTRCEKCE